MDARNNRKLTVLLVGGTVCFLLVPVVVIVVFAMVFVTVFVVMGGDLSIDPRTDSGVGDLPQMAIAKSDEKRMERKMNFMVDD